MSKNALKKRVNEFAALGGYSVQRTYQLKREGVIKPKVIAAKHYSSHADLNDVRHHRAAMYMRQTR